MEHTHFSPVSGSEHLSNEHRLMHRGILFGRNRGNDRGSEKQPEAQKGNPEQSEKSQRDVNKEKKDVLQKQMTEIEKRLKKAFTGQQEQHQDVQAMKKKFEAVQKKLSDSLDGIEQEINAVDQSLTVLIDRLKNAQEGQSTDQNPETRKQSLQGRVQKILPDLNKLNEKYAITATKEGSNERNIGMRVRSYLRIFKALDRIKPENLIVMEANMTFAEEFVKDPKASMSNNTHNNILQDAESIIKALKSAQPTDGNSTNQNSERVSVIPATGIPRKAPSATPTIDTEVSYVPRKIEEISPSDTSIGKLNQDTSIPEPVATVNSSQNISPEQMNPNAEEINALTTIRKDTTTLLKTSNDYRDVMNAIEDANRDIKSFGNAVKDAVFSDFHFEFTKDSTVDVYIQYSKDKHELSYTKKVKTDKEEARVTPSAPAQSQPERNPRDILESRVLGSHREWFDGTTVNIAGIGTKEYVLSNANPDIAKKIFKRAQEHGLRPRGAGGTDITVTITGYKAGFGFTGPDYKEATDKPVEQSAPDTVDTSSPETLKDALRDALRDLKSKIQNGDDLQYQLAFINETMLPQLMQAKTMPKVGWSSSVIETKTGAKVIRFDGEKYSVEDAPRAMPDKPTAPDVNTSDKPTAEKPVSASAETQRKPQPESAKDKPKGIMVAPEDINDPNSVVDNLQARILKKYGEGGENLYANTTVGWVEKKNGHNVYRISCYESNDDATETMKSLSKWATYHGLVAPGTEVTGANQLDITITGYEKGFGYTGPYPRAEAVQDKPQAVPTVRKPRAETPQQPEKPTAPSKPTEQTEAQNDLEKALGSVSLYAKELAVKIMDQGKDHPETVSALAMLNDAVTSAFDVTADPNTANKKVNETLRGTKGINAILSNDGKYYGVIFNGTKCEVKEVTIAKGAEKAGEAIAKGAGKAAEILGKLKVPTPRAQSPKSGEPMPEYRASSLPPKPVEAPGEKRIVAPGKILEKETKVKRDAVQSAIANRQMDAMGKAGWKHDPENNTYSSGSISARYNPDKRAWEVRVFSRQNTNPPWTRVESITDPKLDAVRKSFQAMNGELNSVYQPGVTEKATGTEIDPQTDITPDELDGLRRDLVHLRSVRENREKDYDATQKSSRGIVDALIAEIEHIRQNPALIREKVVTQEQYNELIDKAKVYADRNNMLVEMSKKVPKTKAEVLSSVRAIHESLMKRIDEMIRVREQDMLKKSDELKNSSLFQSFHQGLTGLSPLQIEVDTLMSEVNSLRSTKRQMQYGSTKEDGPITRKDIGEKIEKAQKSEYSKTLPGSAVLNRKLKQDIEANAREDVGATLDSLLRIRTLLQTINKVDADAGRKYEEDLEGIEVSKDVAVFIITLPAGVGGKSVGTVATLAKGGAIGAGIGGSISAKTNYDDVQLGRKTVDEAVASVVEDTTHSTVTGMAGAALGRGISKVKLPTRAPTPRATPSVTPSPRPTPAPAPKAPPAPAPAPAPVAPKAPRTGNPIREVKPQSATPKKAPSSGPKKGQEDHALAKEGRLSAGEREALRNFRQSTNRSGNGQKPETLEKLRKVNERLAADDALRSQSPKKPEGSTPKSAEQAIPTAPEAPSVPRSAPGYTFLEKPITTADTTMGILGTKSRDSLPVMKAAALKVRATLAEGGIGNPTAEKNLAIVDAIIKGLDNGNIKSGTTPISKVPGIPKANFEPSAPRSATKASSSAPESAPAKTPDVVGAKVLPKETGPAPVAETPVEPKAKSATKKASASSVGSAEEKFEGFWHSKESATGDTTFQKFLDIPDNADNKMMLERTNKILDYINEKIAKSPNPSKEYTLIRNKDWCIRTKLELDAAIKRGVQISPQAKLGAMRWVQSQR